METVSGLSDQDLAWLHTKFVLPVAVSRMLRGEETLDDTAEYTLNALLGDFTPDTALLCIGLCAQHLAAHCHPSTASTMLRNGANRLVEEYGVLWLVRQGGDLAIDAATVAHALRFLPEDLEEMAHLLDATLSSIEDHASTGGRLADLLALQAHDHMAAAESQPVSGSNAGKPEALRAKIMPFPSPANN